MTMQRMNGYHVRGDAAGTQTAVNSSNSLNSSSSSNSSRVIEPALAKCVALTGLSCAFIAVERRLHGKSAFSIRASYRADAQRHTVRLSRGMRWALQSAIECACPVLTTGWRRSFATTVTSPLVLIAVPMPNDECGRSALAAVGHLPGPYTTAIRSMQRLASLLDVGGLIAERGATRSGKRISAASTQQDMLLHELRVPLSAAGLLLQRLVSRRPVGQHADESADLMRAAHFAVQEAQSIVRHFSQLQALNQDHLPIRLRPLQVQVVIERAVALLPSSQDSVRRVVPDDLPAIAADPLWLTHILTNLLENATTHTPMWHTTTVTAALSADGGSVVVSVTSNGSSIPLADQESVFRPYQHQRSSDDLTSKGLGLSIARSLVTAMNGDIWVESDGLCSTTFRVALPVVSARDR